MSENLSMLSNAKAQSKKFESDQKIVLQCKLSFLLSKRTGILSLLKIKLTECLYNANYLFSFKA